jgi:hypothetical protein
MTETLTDTVQLNVFSNNDFPYLYKGMIFRVCTDENLRISESIEISPDNPGVSLVQQDNDFLAEIISFRLEHEILFQPIFKATGELGVPANNIVTFIDEEGCEVI